MVAEVKPFIYSHEKQADQRGVELEFTTRNNVKIISCNPISINGMSGYEPIGERLDIYSEERRLIYEVKLFKGLNDSYAIVGICYENFEDNIANFIKIAKSFRLKK